MLYRRCVKQAAGRLALAGLLLAGCQAAPSPTTAPTAVPTLLPTPQLVTAAYTPANRPYMDTAADCAAELPALGLAVEEVSPVLDLPESADALVRYAASEGWTGYAADLGGQPVQVLVHPTNPLRDQLSFAALQAIYRGEITSWDQLLPEGSDLALEVWTYPAGDDLRAAWDQALGLAGPHPPTSGLREAPDPAAMAEAVAASPGAIGFLPADWPAGSAAVLALTDLPDGAGTAVSLPRVALLRAEPDGDLRALLACLQAATNEQR